MKYPTYLIYQVQRMQRCSIRQHCRLLDTQRHVPSYSSNEKVRLLIHVNSLRIQPVNTNMLWFMFKNSKVYLLHSVREQGLWQWQFLSRSGVDWFQNGKKGCKPTTLDPYYLDLQQYLGTKIRNMIEVRKGFVATPHVADILDVGTAQSFSGLSRLHESRNAHY